METNTSWKFQELLSKKRLSRSLCKYIISPYKWVICQYFLDWAASKTWKSPLGVQLDAFWDSDASTKWWHPYDILCPLQAWQQCHMSSWINFPIWEAFMDWWLLDYQPIWEIQNGQSTTHHLIFHARAAKWEACEWPQKMNGMVFEMFTQIQDPQNVVLR